MSNKETFYDAGTPIPAISLKVYSNYIGDDVLTPTMRPTVGLMHIDLSKWITENWDNEVGTECPTVLFENDVEEYTDRSREEFDTIEGTLTAEEAADQASFIFRDSRVNGLQIDRSEWQKNLKDMSEFFDVHDAERVPNSQNSLCWRSTSYERLHVEGFGVLFFEEVTHYFFDRERREAEAYSVGSFGGQIVEIPEDLADVADDQQLMKYISYKHISSNRLMERMPTVQALAAVDQLHADSRQFFNKFSGAPKNSVVDAGIKE